MLQRHDIVFFLRMGILVCESKEREYSGVLLFMHVVTPKHHAIAAKENALSKTHILTEHGLGRQDDNDSTKNNNNFFEALKLVLKVWTTTRANIVIGS
jgi:hypothetical protein